MSDLCKFLRDPLFDPRCHQAADEIERLRSAHEDIVRKYTIIMGDPPRWTNFTADQLKWAREAWYGAAQISRHALGAHVESTQVKSEEPK